MAGCDDPGASVAMVAMSHDINTNVVHGWRKLAREAACHDQERDDRELSRSTHSNPISAIPTPPRPAAISTTA